MRKSIILIFSVILSASMFLAACGPTAQATQAAATEIPAATQAPTVETPAQPTVEEQITLNWLILEYWNPDNVIAAYEAEHPNIKIVAEKVGFADLSQQNQIRLGAGNGSPDIISVDAPLVASYGARGWLWPLDSTFTEQDRAGWVPGAVDAGSYNGKFLAAPQHTSTQLLFYNKDMLEAAGITPPGENDRWTWEQIADAAQRLKKGDVYGFNWEQTTSIYQLQPLPLSLGGKAIGNDGFTVDGVINSPEWIKAFTFYGDAFNKLGYAPKSETPVEQMFASGNLAMFVGGTWNILTLNATPPAFNWGVSRHPYFEGGSVVIPTGSWHFGVNASSAHPQAAADFLRWLTVGAGASIWWGADSYDMPAQIAILDSFNTLPEFQKPPLSYMQVAAKEATVNPVPRPVTPGFLEYQQYIEAAFKDIRNGADVKVSLDTAAQRITQEMAKYQK